MHKEGDESLLYQIAFYKKKAVEWIKFNNAFGVNAQIVKDLGKEINKKLKNGKSLKFFLGRKLTKTGKLYMLGIGAHYFQILEIGEKGEKELKIGPLSSSVFSFEEGDDYNIKQPENFKIRITDIRIFNEYLTSSTEISGALNLEVIDSGSWDIDKEIAVAMRYVIRLPKGTTRHTSYFYCGFPHDSNSTFHFPPITPEDDKEDKEFLHFWGTLDLQFLICQVSKPGGSPFGPTGLPFGSSGSPFGHPGSPFGSSGSPFGHPGSPFGSSGSPFGHPGSPFGSSGSSFGHPGSPFGSSGSSFGHPGSPFGIGGSPYKNREPEVISNTLKIRVELQ
jgi:hypothetical protein